MIDAGRWSDAAEILRRVPGNFPVIERLFITDASGTLMAGVPELPEAIGSSFAHLEWFKDLRRDWRPHVSGVYRESARSVGNVMAVIQDNIKRLLAYSSIAHAGYLLIGFVPGTAEGYASVVFYLVCYLFMNLGAFAVIVALASRGRDFENMESLAGLARVRPGLAALMTLFMVSLAGIPGTAGFMGKWQVFSAAVSAGMSTGGIKPSGFG